MRIDCQKAARTPAWLLATQRPGQVLTPQVPPLGINQLLGAQGGCPGSPSCVEGWSLRWACLGPHQGGYPDPGHKSTATPAAASPLRQELPGREADAARNAAATVPDRRRWLMAHSSRCRPPHTPFTPFPEWRKPPAPASYLLVSASGPRTAQTPLGPPSPHSACPRTQVHSPWARCRARARSRARARPARRASASPD